jgi:ABC-2 type transport system permease protein
MRSLIAAELLKVRTTRALLVAGLLTAAYVLLGPALMAFAPAAEILPPLEPSLLTYSLRSSVPIAGAAFLIVALLGSTGEYAHGTVLTTRLVEPRSTRSLAAKLAAMALMGAVAGVMLVVISLGLTAVALTSRAVAVQPFDHGTPGLALAVIGVMVLHGVLGAAIGSLVRNSAGAVGAVLVWALVIEGVLPVVTGWPELMSWLPSGAVSGLTQVTGPPGQLAPWAAGLLLAGYVGMIASGSMIADRFREI